MPIVIVEAVARRSQLIFGILAVTFARRNINFRQRRLIESIPNELSWHAVMLLLKRLLLVAVADFHRIINVQKILARHVVPSAAAQLVLEAGGLRLLRLLLDVKEIHFGGRQVYHIVTRIFASAHRADIARWRRANHERFPRRRLTFGHEAETADGVVQPLVANLASPFAMVDEAFIHGSVPRRGVLARFVLHAAVHSRILAGRVLDGVLSLQPLAARRRLFRCAAAGTPAT